MTEEKRTGYINDVVRLIDRLGIATAILCFIAWCLVRASTWLGPEVIKPVVNAHVNFLDRTAESAEKSVEAQKNTAKAIDRIHEVEEGQNKILTSVNENQELMLEALGRKGSAGN
jgi:hypothetical protein